MHFYDYLFKWGELKIEEADEEYKNLILKSHEYDEMQESIRNKYPDVKAFICIDKLSATVADKFAQTFLKELYKNISNENLKRKIEEQVINHDKQVEEYINYLKNHEIDEDCVLEQ